MEQLTIQLHQGLTLHQELIELMKENLPISLKYKLFKSLEFLENEKLMFEKLKLELFKKYGEEVDNEIVLIEKNKNDFEYEFSQLLTEDLELTYYPIELSIFDDIKSSYQFKILYKLIKE